MSRTNIIKNIQRGSISYDFSDGPGTVNITSVNRNKSILNYSVNEAYYHSDNYAVTVPAYLEFSTNTTLTWSTQSISFSGGSFETHVSTANGTICWEIVEFV